MTYPDWWERLHQDSHTLPMRRPRRKWRARTPLLLALITLFIASFAVDAFLTPIHNPMITVSEGN